MIRGFPVQEEIVTEDNRKTLPDYPVIPVSTITPKVERWKFPQIYNVGANGATYIHQVGFNGEKIIILYGAETSPETDLEIDVVPKVKRTLQQQAAQQARKRFNDKVAKGYSIHGSNQDIKVIAMKGKRYKDGMRLQRNVGMVTTKFDGERLLVLDKGSHEYRMTSYSGKKDRSHMIYIKEDIDKLIPYLPEEFILDGEMYKPGLERNYIRSLVGKEKEIHPEQHLLSYYLFDLDCNSREPAQYRYQRLKDCYSACISDGNTLERIILADTKIYCNLNEIIEYKERAILEGYEGAVCRYTSIDSRGLVLLDSFEVFMDNISEYDEYEEGSTGYNRSIYSRTNSRTRMLKFKDFIHEEGYILDVVPCANSAKDQGKFLIEDDYGIQFNCLFGTREQKRQWLSNPSLVLGKRFEFKHDGRNERTNIPQQPTGVCFRDD